MLMMRPLLARNCAEKGVRHVEDAVEIDRRDVLPVLDDGVCVGDERVAPVDAGIVDEDRDRAELVGDLRGDGTAGRMIGDVERKTFRLAAGVADFGGRGSGSFTVDVERCDLCALARKSDGDRAADAGACAGDGRDVVLQERRHPFLPFWFASSIPVRRHGKQRFR